MLGAGLLMLLFAQTLGRRDLMTVGIFLMLLPLLAGAGLRLLRPGFTLQRTFSPEVVEAGATATVGLIVSGSRAGGGRVEMRERLPARFGAPPSFMYPSRGTTGGTSRYEYHLVCAQRGQFRIGGASAEFSDPFVLTRLRQDVDAGQLLTVSPAAVPLPPTSLTGGRGVDGMKATRQRANPSNDDVMTRQYRHGDPLRRVHWPATARHGELMVRQEESVTTPEATLLLDQRAAAFTGGLSGVFGTGHEGAHPELATSEAFEWAVVAAMSISAHFLEHSYSVRVLDLFAQPGFLHSRSAPSRHEELFDGSAGLATIAASLAAVELSTPRAAAGRAAALPGDALVDKLATTSRRGPVVALLGQLGPAEAAALAPVAGHGEGAFAILVCEHPERQKPALEVLRRAGWHATAVPPKAPLAQVWAGLDEFQPLARGDGAEVHRGSAAASGALP